MAATLAPTDVVVGGKILLKMDNKIVGFANEATCQDSYGMRPIHVIGQLQPIDYVPTEARHIIDLNVMVLRKSSLITANLEPQGAGNYGFLSLADIGKVSTQEADIEGDSTTLATGNDANQGLLRVLHAKVFDISICMPTYDTTTSAWKYPALVTYKDCSFNSGNVRFNANQITVHQCQFVALDRSGTLSI